MNEQQKKAAEYAEILLAWSRGECVQYWSIEGCWKTLLNNTDEPSWNFGISKYRIAPKPVESWAVIGDSSFGDEIVVTSYRTKKLASNHASATIGYRVALMREVTE